MSSFIKALINLFESCSKCIVLKYRQVREKDWSVQVEHNYASHKWVGRLGTGCTKRSGNVRRMLNDGSLMP